MAESELSKTSWASANGIKERGKHQQMCECNGLELQHQMVGCDSTAVIFYGMIFRYRSLNVSSKAVCAKTWSCSSLSLFFLYS